MAGSVTRDKIVSETKPQITTTAKGFCVSEPMPPDNAAGISPSPAIKAVITRGRTLLNAPFMMASFNGIPNCRYLLKLETNIIPLCTLTPNKALFGVSVQSGIILVSNFNKYLQLGMPLKEAIMKGALSRVRPLVMTALMAGLGLMPAALSGGIGSETQKPLAVVVICGLVSDTILSLVTLPAIYSLRRPRRHEGID